MKAQIANSLLLISFGFLACFFIMFKGCNKPKKNFYGGNTITTKVDTVYISHTDTIRLKETKFIPKYVTIIKRDTLTKEQVDTLLAIRKYEGTITQDSITATYSATTTGRLDSLSIDIIDNRSIMVINKETTINNYPKGIYGGVGLSSKLNPSLNLNYVDKRQIIGLGYSLDKTINLTYTRKLFNIK